MRHKKLEETYKKMPSGKGTKQSLLTPHNRYFRTILENPKIMADFLRNNLPSLSFG